MYKMFNKNKKNLGFIAMASHKSSNRQIIIEVNFSFFFLKKYAIIESKNFERKKKMNLKDYIATIENYPKEGITFRDISPLMADGNAYSYAVREIVQYATDKKIDMIVGPEARGFIVGCPVAFEWELVLHLFVNQ